MHPRSKKTILFLSVAVQLLVGCMTVPSGSSGLGISIPRDSTIAVISKGVDDDLKVRFNRDSTKRGARMGANTGAGAGFVAAQGCGPFVFLCALLTIPTGAVIGAATGAATGALNDADKKPSGENLDKLEAIVDKLSSRRTLHEELRAAIAARVPRARRAPGKEAQALIEISIGNVRLLKTGDTHYEWAMLVNVAAQWNRNSRNPRGDKGQILVSGDGMTLEQWIVDDGRAIENELNHLVAQAAGRIEVAMFP